MSKLLINPKPLDLLPNNPCPDLIDCKDTVVSVVVTVETDKPCSAKSDRWKQVAERTILAYRDIVGDTVKTVTSHWKGMPLAERNRSGETLAKSINNAYRSMEAAIEVAVKKQIEREAQGDKNLLEAQVSAVAKGAFKVIAIGKDVAEVVGTGAVDIKAWYDLVKDLVEAAKMVQDQCKDEARLRADLLKAIGQYGSAKQRRWNEEHKKPDWKSQIKAIVKKIWDEVDDLAHKAEAQRKKYRNQITALTQKVDAMGAKRDKLLALLNHSGKPDAKGLATGVQMIKLGAKVKAMNKFILDSQDFTDDMAYLLTLNGIEVDDRTFVEKMLRLENLSDMKAEGQEVADAAENLFDLIKKIKH